MGECRRKIDFGARKQQHKHMHTGKDRDVREEKGAGGMKEEGQGLWGPREAQAGLQDREIRSCG